MRKGTLIFTSNQGGRRDYDAYTELYCLHTSIVELCLSVSTQFRWQLDFCHKLSIFQVGPGLLSCDSTGKPEQ
ncbi:hypothetical protein I7I50_08948 [Histoplasma capsulatum G186AR]|uniref:Uncharacterized protein n=1 Tax=Ajellomyces capsulatus TaxID=5037 RepID=A0A8H8CZL2_AJECA|nr:hypothetical protein I7I52_06464 [Histoplasma capsulatum]QSS73983.1 hypothetical protein I7I50_08948 [Histoplasma capsulatum G186AR]